MVRESEGTNSRRGKFVVAFRSAKVACAFAEQESPKFEL